MIDSSGIPPLINPRSPIGLHSIVGANPGLHLQVNAPGLLMHSVEARSHWLDAHSFISVESKFYCTVFLFNKKTILTIRI